MKKYINIKNIAASLLVLLFAVTSMFGSSHREAPLISNDPLADNVDLYAFRSPDNPDMITMIATYVPLQLPHGGPNYYTFGENIRYEIHVDNDATIVGDEITYRFTFNITNEDPSTFFNIRLGAQNQKATYTLERSVDGGASFQTIITDGVVPPNNIGPRSITSGAGLNTTYDALFNNAITTASTGETVFAGPTDDPFFVDLGGIFDLGDSPRQDGKNVDGVACFNVSAIAIQVPISTLLKAGAPSTPTNILDPDYVIGVWASASRPAIKTISSDSDPSYSGDWIQVSRLGMPLTNEAVIAIGDKDAWNATSPYAPEEASFYDYFYNPELALYMDDSQFGGAVPSLAPLRIQSNSLGAFDFRNGKDGLFGLKGDPALDGTALDDAVFGTLLLPAAGNPRSVDLWPIFHTGVPNVIPYQLATGKDGNPLAAGKPFINNFLPNAGDMLRLNMAVPATPRDDANFSSLGLVQAAAIGLTVAPFNTTTDIEFIPNMDGFPNGRRLEDDVTRIELQAVGGIVLAAVGLWYDDFDGTTPLTDDLLGVLTYTTGVESNDLPFTGSFPYLALPHDGTGPCSGELQFNEQPPLAEADAQVFVSSNTTGKIGVYGFTDDGAVSASTLDAVGADADGIFFDKENDVLYQLNRSDNVINAFSGVASGSPTLTATSSSDFVNGREIAFSNGKIVVAQDANGANGMVNQFVVYDASGSSISLDKVITTDINLWGIIFDGDDLVAVVDNSNDVAIYSDFLSTPAGSASPDRVIDINGIVRTHGLDYDATNDVMVLTDVGAASSPTDGAISVINNWTAASADNSVRGGEQFRLEGSNSLLGNPVDVAYDHEAGKVYVAERANGGGRFLTFATPTGDGDADPIANEFFPGASAVTIADCREDDGNNGGDPMDACDNVFVSSNTTGTIGAYECTPAGSLESASFNIAGMDADGIYYDSRDDAIYQLNRTDNVLQVFTGVSSGNPTLTATSTSDFINGRELAYSRGKIVVAQDANDANGNENKLLVYSARTNRIRLEKEFPVDINLWGITFDGDDLVAVIDNSSDIAVYTDFTRKDEGSVSPDRVVSINGLVRTHGVDYDSRNDIMLLTDVGEASSATDGAIIMIRNWSTASADGTITGSEQRRIEGPMSLLGNPVDVHYDHSAEKIYVAERANDGGRFLVFDLPTGDGDVAPVKMASFPGASAVNMGCRSNPGSGSNNGGGVIEADPETIVYYSLDQCNSRTGTTQTHVDYSEFVPAYPNALDCGIVNANNVQRDNPTSNPHSCTPGVNGSIAMCVGSSNSCTFRPNDSKAVTFTVTLDPSDGEEAYISGLTFFEMAPRTFDWIDGAKGQNNYPTQYGLRILKDGTEIFSSIGLDATGEWTLESFDFTDDAFTVTSRSEFYFELLGYCTVQNGASVDAWDLDEISVIGGCTASQSALLSGLVYTEQGVPVEGVRVINNTNHPEYPITNTTDKYGEFIFESNPAGKSYNISTVKDDDYSNGVSTLDLVKIQRHILGLDLLSSPYAMIAADVNRSMNISAADLISLRRVILGIEDEFQNNYSWLFVSTDEELDNRYPYAFDGAIQIADLSEMIYDNDFVGVKVGDVNGTAVANSTHNFAEVRSDISLDLNYSDRAITKGEIYNVDITSTNFEDVYGFQFTTELNGVEILDVKSNGIDFTMENIGVIRPEVATVSFASGYAANGDADVVLFTLQLEAKSSGMLSDMISISNSVTPIEAYINNSFEEVSVTLNATDVINTAEGFALYQNTPNPFNASTDISFNMMTAGEASITIFDTAGKKIYQTTRNYSKGYNSVTIESSDLRSSSNILFYQLSAEGFTATKKMTLID